VIVKVTQIVCRKGPANHLEICLPQASFAVSALLKSLASYPQELSIHQQPREMGKSRRKEGDAAATTSWPMGI
jgi:hypothetical protein